jgi:hypothetical protein
MEIGYSEFLLRSSQSLRDNTRIMPKSRPRSFPSVQYTMNYSRCLSKLHKLHSLHTSKCPAVLFACFLTALPSNLQSCMLIVNELYGAQAREADSPSPSEDVRCLLWNRMLHCRLQQPTPLDPTLSQFNPSSTLIQYFFKINCNIILPSTIRSGRKVLLLYSSHMGQC